MVGFTLKLFNKLDFVLFNYIKNIEYVLSILFNTLIALLLLYLFNPFFKAHEIDDTVKMLLFFYSFILFLIIMEKIVDEKVTIKYLRHILKLDI
jgi:hypothetical protein